MRVLKRACFWSAVCVVVAGVGTAGAREVSGIVRDQVTGAPLVVATIIVAETHDITFTDSQGRYYFANIPDGVYTFVVGKAGYSPHVLGRVSVSPSCCMGRVGDANGAGGDEPTIGDVSTLIDAKFISGSCDGIVPCLAEGDINQSGGSQPTCDDITIGDISTLIDYLFITGSTLGLPNCL